MENECQFSPCRRYRYSLKHVIIGGPEQFGFGERERLVAWIMLNPSTADERQLDPTLRRVRGYSQAWQFTGFIILNLFAYRATRPEDMKAVADPVGPENNRLIFEAVNTVETVICGWGIHGAHNGREAELLGLAEKHGVLGKFNALAKTIDGFPSHPLYLKSDLQPFKFP